MAELRRPKSMASSPGQSTSSSPLQSSRARGDCPLTSPIEKLSISGNQPSSSASSMASNRTVKSRGFIQRPGFGEEGRPIELKTNFFPLRFNPNTKIFHYDLDITKLRQSTPGGDYKNAPQPELDINSKRFKRLRGQLYTQVIQEAVRNNSGPGGYFENITPVFDGARNLYTAKEIQPIRTNPLVRHRIMVEVDVNGRMERYAFNIKLASIVDFNQLNRYFEGELAEPPHECMQALDIILRYGPSYLGIPISSSIYLPAAIDKNRSGIGMGQQLAFGFYQSVHAVKYGPTLVVDRTTALFHVAGPVLDYVANILEVGRNQFRPDHFQRHNLYKISNSLKSLEVKVSHLTYKRRYKVREISDKPANKIEMDYERVDENGIRIIVGRITIAEFYQRHYGKQLQFPYLPCIVTGTKERPNYLPLELCELVADQPVKVVSAKATSEMIRSSARQMPNQRLLVIENSIKMSKTESKPYLNEFDIQVRNNPIKIKGRVLEPPTLQYGKGTIKPTGGKWDLRMDTELVKPVQLRQNEWAVVILSDNVNKGDVDSLVRRICDIGASRMGMEIDPPCGTLKVRYDPGKLRDTFIKIRSRANALRFVLFVVYQSNDLYREIKLLGDCVLRVATQCVHEKKSRSFRDDLYVVNLLLKINAKLGGVNSCFVDQVPNKPKFLCRSRVMTIGIDFTHPSPGERLSASICACVASADASQSKWLSSVRINRGNAQVDLVTHLDEMMATLYKAYAERNGFFPESVVIYRDGISEAQFHKVLTVEMKSFHRAFEKAKAEMPNIEVNCDPKLTLLIVQKHHRARFVPVEVHGTKACDLNVPPGTVVDSDIVHPCDFDYYLTSHEGLQGTSRPTHYYVLRDDNNFQADELQKLTFHLTFCFIRCMRSISSPAPVAYANLVAYRARHHFMAADMNGIRGNFDYPKHLTKDVTKDVLYFV